MKINQRYDNRGDKGMEKTMNSKVYENYRNYIDHNFHDTSMSFDSIETPGWTSLVGTQQSKSTHALKKNNHEERAYTQNQILTRLNSLPKLKEKQEVEYSNIRVVPSSAKNKNVFVYGSLKEQQKKKIETLKSTKAKHLQSNSSLSRLVNRFNKGPVHSSQKQNLYSNNQNSKPNVYFSASRNSQQKVIQDSRRRVQSARSQSSTNLKEQIKQRLSMGNYKPKNIPFEFESNIKTEPNEKIFESSSKKKSPTKFYSHIHSFQPIRQEKYMDKYLQKLNQRTKSTNSVKIFKKANAVNETKENKILAQQSANQPNSSILPLTLKRFNTITVHDHLYRNHIKLQSKKQMQRQIDESYQKANTLTFSPFISEKSHFLAQSKFSRQSNGQYLSGDHHNESCFRKGKILQNQSKQIKNNIFTIQEQVAIRQKQKMAEKQLNRSLIKLFMILSNHTNQINDRTLEVNIEKLPLALLEILQPLLTQIYKKNIYNQREFIEVFSQSGEKSIKSIAAKKQIIATHTERLVKLLDKNKKKHQDKENIADELNYHQKVSLKLLQK